MGCYLFCLCCASHHHHFDSTHSLRSLCVKPNDLVRLNSLGHSDTSQISRTWFGWSTKSPWLAVNYGTSSCKLRNVECACKTQTPSYCRHCLSCLPTVNRDCSCACFLVLNPTVSNLRHIHPVGVCRDKTMAQAG